MKRDANPMPCLLAGFLLAGAFAASPALAADSPAERNAALAHFESRIRPVLAEHCYECHSAEAGKSRGGLRVDDREALLRGGDSGPALVPGKPGESLLLAAIRHEEPDLEMPPKKGPLPERIALDIEAWIAAGAVDPREPTADPDAASGDLAAWKDHWSYRPPAAADLPEVTLEDWAVSGLDRFVLARLEAEGLSPSPDADPVTLLRRLSFDLTGLPPSPEQVRAFSLDRLEETVDALLASSGFGARWGRHWLDVARYAESNGKEANLAYPHAWRYRDYVIDAFNRDLPYDQFLTEQLAGDLLPSADDEERARRLIATGFLALGPKGLSENNPVQFRADVVDEQIDAFSRAMLASSLACARCHDHKSDPFSMADYYALAGIFQSTDTRFGTWIDSESNQGSGLVTLPALPGQLIPNRSIPPEEMEKIHAQLAQLDEDDRTGREKAEQAAAEGRDLQAEFNDMLREVLRIYWSRGPLVGKLATVDEEGNALPLCMGVLEAGEPVDSPRYERGEIAHPAETVPRGVPALFGIPGEGPAPAEASGRLELARWITRPEHPLAARVMANRVWGHLFGAGLVETADDFGRTGSPPSHPELLDHLALRFLDQGWSVKALVREIVLSRAYRQASAWREDCFEADPDNRLLWRVPKRRLDAEVIRDSMLAVSGELDPSPRPGSLVTELTGQSISLIGFNPAIPADLDGSTHRSIYLPVLRDHLPDVLELFDFAEPSLVTGTRDTTNVPSQALYLMNSSFVRARAEALAQRVAREAPGLEARIARAFELCFHRLPDAEETRLAAAYFEEALDLPDPPSPEALLASFCQALLSSADFRIAD